MRVGVVSEGILEQIALGTGLVPSPLVLTSFGMMSFRSIIAGMRLGVFEAFGPLGQEEKSLQEVADALRCSEVGTEVLLHALLGLGYLRRKQGRYTTTSLTRRWLLQTSRFSMCDALLFLGDLWDHINNFEEAIRRGSPPRLHDADLPVLFWQRYMRGLGTFAKVAAHEVVRKAPMPISPKRLLDVGGGHGLYSAALCKRYLGLAAEVLDLEPAIVHGQKIIEEAGAKESVHFRAGDFRKVDWGTGYDAVLLFNVLHNATEDEAGQMVKRAFSALTPGGSLLVLDAAHEGGSGNLSQAAGFNELFFFVVSGARAYGEPVMRGWMETAGFSSLRSYRMRLAPAVLLSGKKPT